MALTEEQQTLTELLEDFIEDEIEAIGVPTLEDDVIHVDFQYGESVYSAIIDPDAGTIQY